MRLSELLNEEYSQENRIKKLYENSSNELPDVVENAFKDLANEQRGLPEQAMREIQTYLGGGVYGFVVEHVGDLIHRMNEMPTYNDFGAEYVYDKVDKSLRTLMQKYGFEKEMYENFKSNSEYNKIPYEEYVSTIKKLGKKYANEHRQLPIYNEVQWLANQAAISLGEFRFDRATAMLMAIQNLFHKKSSIEPDTSLYVEKASEYNLQDGQLQLYKRN